MQLIRRASSFLNNTAIISNQRSYTYDDLLNESEKVAIQILNGREDLHEARVAFMVNPGFDYVKTQWGIWRSGGVAVPLHPGSPFPSIQYILEDTKADTVIIDQVYQSTFHDYAKSKGIRLINTNEQNSSFGSIPEIDSSRRAMILYTSGTTGLPKGVVTTHYNIEAQIKSLVQAWEWRETDHILNILPMHHVHGIINILSCALWSGASCQFLPKFNSKEVCEVFKEGNLSLFMAVPTIYHKLISYWESVNNQEQQEISDGLRTLRLMVSGSAALPVSVMQKWESISGHILLERYGMTEIGMAISNPYKGERLPGHIGQALPGVDVILVNESYEPVLEGEQGEILVMGDNVFKEYWNKPEATEQAFTHDLWFKTGDVAINDSGSYKIIGRSSVDIIKSGGYKISALEIEEVLRGYDGIKDCGVVGVLDQEWGELICAAIIPDDGVEEVDFKEVDQWIRTQLPVYKVPRKYIFLEDLPRNAMGKVTKNELKKLF